MNHIWSIARIGEQSRCVYCDCAVEDAVRSDPYCEKGTKFIEDLTKAVAKAKVDIAQAVSEIPMRPLDKIKLSSKGWDLMIYSFHEPGPNGMTNGWLSVKLLHKLSLDQLKGLRLSPYAGCVGVNAGRVYRELLRRAMIQKGQDNVPLS